MDLQNVHNEVKQMAGKDHLQEILSKYKNLKQATEYYKDMPPTPKYSTGFDLIDRALNGGIETGVLVGVGGKADTGKTTLTVQMLENVSRGFKSAYFSWEFGVRKYVERRKRDDSINGENILIIDEENDIEDVCKTIETLTVHGGYKFFLIDSQMRIQNKNFNGNVTEKTDDIFSKLSSIATKLEIVIFIIVQTSLADHRNSEPSVRYSVNAQHELSIFMFLEKSEDDAKKVKLRFIKMKQMGDRKPLELEKTGNENLFNTKCFETEVVFYSENKISFPRVC